MATRSKVSRAKVCTDRILPRDMMRLQPTRRMGGRTRAIAPIGKTWMNGSTLRVKFLGGTAAQRALVKEQATESTELGLTAGSGPSLSERSDSSRPWAAH